MIAIHKNIELDTEEVRNEVVKEQEKLILFCNFLKNKLQYIIKLDYLKCSMYINMYISY